MAEKELCLTKGISTPTGITKGKADNSSGEDKDGSNSNKRRKKNDAGSKKSESDDDWSDSSSGSSGEKSSHPSKKRSTSRASISSTQSPKLLKKKLGRENDQKNGDTKHDQPMKKSESVLVNESEPTQHLK